MEELIKDNNCYCPLCNNYYEQSEYLTSVFQEDNRVKWLANMVTHYRHNHITSWNKCWGKHGSRYRASWFGDYDEEKRKINERAKRQIIRKATPFLKEHGISVEDFMQLQHNDQSTLTLAKNKL